MLGKWGGWHAGKVGGGGEGERWAGRGEEYMLGRWGVWHPFEVRGAAMQKTNSDRGAEKALQNGVRPPLTGWMLTSCMAPPPL